MPTAYTDYTISNALDSAFGESVRYTAPTAIASTATLTVMLSREDYTPDQQGMQARTLRRTVMRYRGVLTVRTGGLIVIPAGSLYEGKYRIGEMTVDSFGWQIAILTATK